MATLRGIHPLFSGQSCTDQTEDQHMAEERAAQIFDGGPNNVATMSEYIANIGAVSS